MDLLVFKFQIFLSVYFTVKKLNTIVYEPFMQKWLSQQRNKHNKYIDPFHEKWSLIAFATSVDPD